MPLRGPFALARGPSIHPPPPSLEHVLLRITDTGLRPVRASCLSTDTACIRVSLGFYEKSGAACSVMKSRGRFVALAMAASAVGASTTVTSAMSGVVREAFKRACRQKLPKSHVLACSKARKCPGYVISLTRHPSHSLPVKTSRPVTAV